MGDADGGTSNTTTIHEFTFKQESEGFPRLYYYWTDVSTETRHRQCEFHHSSSIASDSCYFKGKSHHHCNIDTTSYNT